MTVDDSLLYLQAELDQARRNVERTQADWERIVAAWQQSKSLAVRVRLALEALRAKRARDRAVEEAEAAEQAVEARRQEVRA